jgi:CRISPR-associated endonuclease Csn1
MKCLLPKRKRGRSIALQLQTGNVDMKDYVLNEKPELASNEMVWAFDLGKGSIGEAVRQGTKFLHKTSLLIPAEFAETKSARDRRRMKRTRDAHKAREKWLNEVMRAADIEILKGRQIGKVDGKWTQTAKGDYRLEREFPPRRFKKNKDGKLEPVIYPDDKAKDGAPARTDEDFSTCYNSALLRIKLLRGEKLEPWQVYKALHSAIQRRGYDPDIPWKHREQRKTKSGNADDDEAGTQQRMEQFEKDLEAMSPGKSEYYFPCYFDAWKMGLWNPAKPDELKDRTDCHAESTRNQIVPRKLVEEEIRKLVDGAAKHYLKLKDKASYILYGPTETAYASFDAKLRKKHDLKEGGLNDWQGVLGQKIPRFDNRIIGKCVLIPRLNVCKIRTDENGELHPQSRIAAETVFLMRLKNMRFQTSKGQSCLTAKQIAEVFSDPKRTKLGMTAAQWKKYCHRFGAKPMLGQYQEVEEPSFSGRSRFCRPALEILKRLILSGDTPAQAYEKEVARLNGNTNPVKGLVKDDLKFLLQMGKAWEGIYIPNQKLDALARSTDDSHEAISQLIGSQNDPIVRHRLTLFAKRLDYLGVTKKLGTPDYVVLEFVREDFMGKKAKFEYFKFQRDRAHDRAKAREDAAKAGAEERSAGLKMELLKAQVGECLYTNAKLIPEKLDEYDIDHIVPRAKGGPDAAVNYVLTTRHANDDKGDRTPYEWLSSQDGWDAYVERVKKRIGTLRNKKVQLLTSPDAETLVEKYTALAETAWISKLAQTIIGLRFGWVNGNDREGNKRVIVVSGGLTGRIRRKYKLNSLLNPYAKSEEEAETKNRNDERHHALDAMVISFIPNWARNAKSTGFFRFPDEVHRELFGREIAEVIPQNVCFEKPALAETIYGARTDHGKQVIVQRAKLVSLGMRPTALGKSVFDLKYAAKQVQSVRDCVIQERLLEFLTTDPDEAKWRKFCAGFHIKRKDGSNGPRVEYVTVNVGEPTEYKDMSKDGTGAYRKALKGHKGQIVYVLSKTDKKGVKKEVYAVRPIYAFESAANVSAALRSEFGQELQVKGVLQSGCLVQTEKETFHAKKPLPPGKYLLNTIITDSNAVKLTTMDGHTYPDIPLYSLASLFAAGMKRIGL